MLTNPSSTYKSNCLLLPLAFIMILISVFSSCKGKEENFAGMDASCAVLTQAKMIDGWETPGYLKSIQYLTFYSSYNQGTGKFEVGVQAFKKDDSKIGSYIDLTQGTRCQIKLPVGTAISENNIELAEMGILKDPETLKDFDYLRLTPKGCPERGVNFLCFDLETVTGGVSTPLAKVTLPCPPCIYCKPPCDDAIQKTIDPSVNDKDSSGQKAQ